MSHTYSQLTLDGRAVTHPPPRPKVTCPECRKLVTLTGRGELHQHNIYTGERCPMSGRRYEQ